MMPLTTLLIASLGGATIAAWVAPIVLLFLVFALLQTGRRYRRKRSA